MSDISCETPMRTMLSAQVERLLRYISDAKLLLCLSILSLPEAFQTNISGSSLSKTPTIMPYAVHPPLLGEQGEHEHRIRIGDPQGRELDAGDHYQLDH
jgi:hypothetical protein